MTKEEIIKRFCQLSTLVGGEHFNHFKSYDCFCEKAKEQRHPLDNFQFENAVFEFIEQAVKEKMADQKKPKEVASNMSEEDMKDSLANFMAAFVGNVGKMKYEKDKYLMQCVKYARDRGWED